MDHDEKLTINVEEAGRILGLGRAGAYIAAREGQLPILRFGRTIRVSLPALRRLIENAKTKAEAQAEK